MPVQREDGRNRRRIRPVIWLIAGIAIIAALYVVSPPWRNDVSHHGEGVPAREPAARKAASMPQAPTHNTSRQPVTTVRDSRDTTVSELRNASPSYRNTTFLVAIHDAGFVCEVVSAVTPVGVPAHGWRVECPEGFAYAVSLEPTGALKVTPTPWSIDVNPNSVPGTPPEPNSIPRLPPEFR